MCADLEQIIPEPKLRSKQWLSTCFPLASEDPDAQLCGVGYQVRHGFRLISLASALPLSVVMHSMQMPCIRLCTVKLS